MDRSLYKDVTLDGIMLGQAAMCNPWSLTSYQPSIEELYQTSIDHLHLCMANEFYFDQESNFDRTTSTLIQPTQEKLNEISQLIIQGDITTTST